ncbi:MAG: glutathione S-transferase [Oceanospirillaceae bacterium]|nr:glutathione S-transferase [Oceanospirillaceae bacterium]
MKLYDLDVSGNCYKVRLFAALAGIELTLVPVDFMAGEHKRAPITDLNPLGQIPVLVDGDVSLRDSHAILVYLARAYGGHQWWPEGAAQQGEVMQWLSNSANEIQNGPNAARLVDKFGLPLDKERTLQVSGIILPFMEQHLASNEWLALGRPTIADCAIFPYLAVAWEGGIDMAEYPNISAWMERIKALPNFVPMPGMR